MVALCGSVQGADQALQVFPRHSLLLRFPDGIPWCVIGDTLRHWQARCRMVSERQDRWVVVTLSIDLLRLSSLIGPTKI